MLDAVLYHRLLYNRQVEFIACYQDERSFSDTLLLNLMIVR